MQRILVLNAPYGAAFTFAPNPTGGPHNIWLIYDSSADSKIVEWLRDTLAQHEAFVRSMLEQSAAPSQSVQPVSQSILDKIGSMPASSTSPTGHDWGGSYRLGLSCKKCGQTADGFEKACISNVYIPMIGDIVIDKRDGKKWTIEDGQGTRWLMYDGPVVMLDQMQFVERPPPTPPKT